LFSNNTTLRHTCCDFAISGQKRQHEEHQRIFGNQFLFLIEELSDDTLPIFEPVKTCDFDELSTMFLPFPEMFIDILLNILAANSLNEYHLLPENENNLNLES
jgi:hypothetical protein